MTKTIRMRFRDAPVSNLSGEEYFKSPRAVQHPTRDQRAIATLDGSIPEPDRIATLNRRHAAHYHQGARQ